MLSTLPTRRSSLKSRTALPLLPVLAALFCLLYGSPRLAFADSPAADAGKVTPVNPADYQDKVRVACVGDSITFGAGIKDRDHNSYPAQLGRMLGERWDVKNFGHSGATLLNNGDLPYVKTREYKVALAFKPNVVIIFLGTNDSKPQNWKHKDGYAADYKSLIGDFRKADPKVRVYACLPVPAFPGNFGIRDEIIKNEVVPQIKPVAADTGATLIDLYAALSDKNDLFPDKVHPNAAGAELMARAVCRALTGKEAPAREEDKKNVDRVTR